MTALLGLQLAMPQTAILIHHPELALVSLQLPEYLDVTGFGGFTYRFQ